MKTILAALAAAPLLMTGPVVAQDPEASLVGTWVVTDLTGKTWEGRPMSGDNVTVEYEITEHDGPIFVGVVRWHFNTDQPGPEVTTDADESFMGVRDFDGDWIVVEYPDTSYRRFRLTDANTLEMLSYDAGPRAFVVRATLVRQ